MLNPQAIAVDLLTKMKGVIIAEVYARVALIPMLSHYTSLDAFRSILQAKELWFSCAKDMKDTSEISEGAQVVADALEKLGPSLFKSFRFSNTDTRQRFTLIQPTLQAETYVMSLCEHGSDQRADRLTMWREYGHGGNGLCLVFRKITMLGQQAKGLFPVHWSPIEYETRTQLEERVQRRLMQFDELFAAAPAGALRLLNPMLGPMIASGVLNLVFSHKNENYYDEKEIRFIRSPLMNNNPLPAGAVYRNVGTSAKPRNVFVLPLRNYPEFPINASIEALLDRIIIGPSPRQNQIFDEVTALLKAEGLTGVQVQRSQIPIFRIAN